MKSILYTYKELSKKISLGLILFVLFCIFQVKAQNQEDARYRKIVKEYTLHEDGTITMKYTQELEYLSYYAIHRKYGESSVIYNPNGQKVDINYAYSIMKDGKKVNTPENAFNEVLPHEAIDAPAYNHLRRLVITHTGLEIGAVSHLSYTVTSKAGFLPAFMGEERILQSAPCDQLIIRIKSPKSIHMNFSLHNMGHKEIDTNSEDGCYVHTIEFNDLAAYSLESNQPLASQYEPFFLLSSKLLKDIYLSFISQKAFRFELNEKMKQWVDEIEKESSDQMQFIMQLQEKVATNFATYPLSLEQTNYTVRTPEEVFFSRGGTKIEKAALLVACMQYKGIKAYPVMVSSFNGLSERTAGSLNVFDDFLVRINHIEGYLYLPVDYVTDQNLKYSLSNKSLVSVYNGISVFEIVEEKVFTNKAVIIGDIKIGDEVEILAKNEAGFNPWLRILKNEKAGFDNLYTGLTIQKDEERVAEVYKLDSYNSEYELDAQLNFSAISIQDKYYFLTLPKYKLGIDSWHLDVLNPKRNSDYEIPSDAFESYDYEIKLERGNSFSKGKYSIYKKSYAGEVVLEVKIKKRKAHIQKQLRIKKGNLPSEKYAELRELLLLWNSDEFNTLIYKKK